MEKGYAPPIKRKQPTLDELVTGVRGGDRMILARAITLVESNTPQHMAKAQELLQELLPDTGKAIRIGVTGVPGAGKSTFINRFGQYLCQKQHKVAVLAVDPSSSLSGGSILGDKTRMDELSREENCFIRPSPSGGVLGGVSRKTRETILLCEAAGYDVILVETVGVGQSESLVSTMVDFFLLFALTGAGDELQNFKKGVIEMADAIVINKADGDNQQKAESAAAEFNHALHYLAASQNEWETRANTCSAKTGKGIPEVWKAIRTFQKITQQNHSFEKKRQQQSLQWLHESIIDRLKTDFYQNKTIQSSLPEIESQVRSGTLPVSKAVKLLLKRRSV